MQISSRPYLDLDAANAGFFLFGSIRPEYNILAEHPIIFLFTFVVIIMVRHLHWNVMLVDERSDVGRLTSH